MTFVDVKNVSLTYRLGKETTLALADATLGIDKGEFIAVVGPSGCGKSTIMKLVTGLLPASGGEVTVAGRKVTGPIKGVGMAFQNPTLMPWRTTIDNILLPMEVVEPHKRRFRSNRAEYVERAMKLLRTVGLNPDYRTRYPHEFSGGQRQRISIARALASQPEFLVCDEPTSALDVSVQAQVLNIMKDLQREQGLTYLFISHNLAVVSHVADRIGVMYLGRLVEVADKAELFARQQADGLIATARQFGAGITATGGDLQIAAQLHHRRLLVVADDVPRDRDALRGAREAGRGADLAPGREVLRDRGRGRAARGAVLPRPLRPRREARRRTGRALPEPRSRGGGLSCRRRPGVGQRVVLARAAAGARRPPTVPASLNPHSVPHLRGRNSFLRCG